MRFRVMFRSQRDQHLVLRLENGKTGRVNPASAKHLKAGDTGRVVHDRRIRFVLDAIDAE